MADKSKIEWTSPPLRVRATAAARIGITLDEYDSRDRDPYPWIDRGLLSFPDQWIALIALNFEHAGLLEVA